MKNALIFLLLLSAPVLAQNRTVNSININGRDVSLIQLMRESRSIKASTGPISTTPKSNTLAFGATCSGGASLAVAPGRAALILSLQASSTGQVQAYSSNTNIVKLFGSALLGQAISGIDQVFGPNGGGVSQQTNIMLGSEGNFDIQFRYLGTAGGVEPYNSASIQFLDITADFHYDAKKVIMIVGESTSWSSMETDPSAVAYPGESLYGFRLCDSLRTQGKSVRLVNKAFGSASSNHVENARRSGYYDIPYDLMVVSLAINDAFAGTSIAAYKKNLRNLIIQRNRNWNPATQPQKPSVVFMSCPPTDVNVAAYRTAMQEVAADAEIGGTANRVYFNDGTGAFLLNATPTADLNFALSNRTAGNRIHYSGPGHNLIFLNLFQTVLSTPFYTAF